jgi:hypothetical protein
MRVVKVPPEMEIVAVLVEVAVLAVLVLWARRGQQWHWVALVATVCNGIMEITILEGAVAAVEKEVTLRPIPGLAQHREGLAVVVKGRYITMLARRFSLPLKET